MSSVNFLDKLLDGVGVEWLPLGDITNYEQPTKYLVAAKNYSDEFKTPVLTAGKTFILGYTDEVDGIYKGSKNPVIIFDDFTTANKWVDFDFKVKSSAMKMITSSDEEKTLLKYIYYWLNTVPSEFVDGDHKRQWIGNYTSKKIPIPCPDNPKKSLEIQAEIVRILDTFAELIAELTAELTARKKQYNYYRDQLLSFEEGEVEWKTVGELFPFVRNGFVGTVTPFYTNSENGVRYLQGTNIQKGTINDRNKYYVTKQFHEKCSRTKLKADDILVVQSGHVGESAVVGERYEGCNCHALIVMSNGGKCNSKFVNYFLQTPEGKARLAKITTGGTVKHILASKIKKLEIPLPPLTEQARIVAILDKFDALTHSLTEGLPREIELRQKQYEYYRDLLLSFPRPDAEGAA